MARDSAGTVDCLIFTRDRPAQLDLLLRSIRRYASRLYERVSVQWHASDNDFLEGYSVVATEHARAFDWNGRDTDASVFEHDVRRWLTGAGSLVTFLVDDDVFYRDAPAGQDILERHLPLSLRGGDYWYPFSVDGNIYRRETVVRLVDGIRFGDPTQLEAYGHDLRHRLPFVEVAPVLPACLVGIPANRVSPSSGMPHMDVSPLRMLERFLAGERLILPALTGQLPAHLELELEWSEVPVPAGRG